MTERDVALTDYALAALCAALCAGAARWPGADLKLRGLWMLFFASIGTGALFGGTVHGFFLDEAGDGHRVLWPASLLAIGVTATTMWFIGSALHLRGAAAMWAQGLAVAQFAAYAWVVLFVTNKFYVAIVEYLPATLFLLVVLLLVLTKAPDRQLALGVAGFLLTFVAAAVQQLRIAIHPVYFNHNALYHLIQGVALSLIYVGAKGLTITAAALEGHAT